MTQQTTETNFYSMDNIDFTLITNPSQPSLPGEEINTPIRYDYNTSESFYEIDIADLFTTSFPYQSFNDLLNDFKAVEQFDSFGPIGNDINDLFEADMDVFHSTESNDTENPIQSTDEQLAMIKSNDTVLPVIRSHVEKLQMKNQLDQSIFLSQSVAVTVPTPNRLQLVHPLEETYRARYKSDYFPQNGTPRRPRYVADNVGNHCVTLQMPAKYHRNFFHEYVRVALITTLANDNQHYYSPYKFQTNHDDAKVPDQNPVYLPVHPHKENDLMKLHLVLIKSKLDQLYDAQPLQPFSDTIGTLKNISSEEKLTSKELINTYQLDKSHLAFTLCTKLPDGSYDIHPETTVKSSVISETSTKASPVSNNKSKTLVQNNGKRISCPNCQHCFDPNDTKPGESGIKRKPQSRTPRATSKITTKNRTNKKKNNTV